MISVWVKESYYRDADVLIAGGGLMGLWTAYALMHQKPDLKVTICEMLPVPALASTRNAGFACFGSPSELWADVQRMGEDAVWEVVEMRYRGISKIRQVLGDVVIDYDACGGYELYHEDTNWNGIALREKLDVLNRGFSSITGLDKMYVDCTETMKPMGLKGFAAMAGNTAEGGLHSGKMVMALQQMVRQMGAVYLEGHCVSTGGGDVQGSVDILDTKGNRIAGIQAPVVIWSANAGLGKLNALRNDIKPARGQVLLSPPVPGLTLRGTFHFDEGFYYFRNLGNRLLIGGGRNAALEEEETMADEPTPFICNLLRTFVEKHFTQVASWLEKDGWMQWAGIMGMSRTKKPIVQEIAPGQWAALACNGMGVALTPMVAERVAKSVLKSQV